MSKPESGEPNVTHGVVTIRNKVTTKQAVQLTWANWTAICDFVPKPWFIKGVYLDRNGQPLPDDRWRCGDNNDDIGLIIRTLESNEFLVKGNDWIIRGLNGEFYACKPDIFEKSYEIIAGVSAQGSQTEFPPLVDFEPHKSGGVTAIVGGFSFRAANEGEAGSRLRKYLVAECMKLPSRFTAEEQLANLKLAISAQGSEPSQPLKCEICGEGEVSETCPCGKRMCSECTDYGIYTDEVSCKPCADETRQSWKDCPQHDFEEPYENEDGDMIRECRKCCYPEKVAPTPSVSTGEADRFYCMFCDLRIYQDKNDVLFPNSWRHHGSNAITSEYPDRHHATPKEQSGEVAKLAAKDAEIAKLKAERDEIGLAFSLDRKMRERLESEIAEARQTIADQKKRIAELERGEFICKKCYLRKDSDYPKGDF